MSAEKGNALIWCRPYLQFLYAPLAGYLRESLGCGSVGLVTNKKDIAYFKGQDKSGAIYAYHDLSDFYDGYGSGDQDPAEVTAKAEANERKYGFLYVDILQTDRHLGRGYAAGGPGHPRSRLSQRADHTKSLAAINRAVAFFEELIDRENITLMVGVASGLAGKTACLVARGMGIRIRELAWAKTGDHFYWSPDEFYSFPGLEQSFLSLAGKGPEDLSAVELSFPEGEVRARKSTLAGAKASTAVKRMARAYLEHFYRKIRGVRMGAGYPPNEIARLYWNQYRDFNALMKMPLYWADDLRREKYFFYALNTEPETATSVLSPEFNEQLAIVEMLAKNLPAGCRLVVKEHIYAVGRRPGDFYRTLLEMTNVRLADFRENALKLAERSVATVVLSSTLGLEAVQSGLPVLAFGRHNWWDFVPHVHVVDSWLGLRDAIEMLVKNHGDQAAASQRRLDGARLVEAIKLSTMDCPGMYLRSNQAEIAPATLRTVCQGLVESLRTDER